MKYMVECHLFEDFCHDGYDEDMETDDDGARS